MAAVLIEVADAIVAELNDDPLTNFGRVFVAERSYPDWELQLKGDPALRVDVVPIGYKSSELVNRGTSETRGDIAHMIETHIGIRRNQIEVDEQGRRDRSVIDGLVEVAQKISDYFVQRELSTYEAATWEPTEKDRPIESTYVPKHLHEWGQFTSILRLTHEVCV